MAQNDERGPIEIVRTFKISWTVSRDIIEKRRSVFLIGEILYKDVFGGTWNRRFVWEYDLGMKACKLRHEETKQESRSPTLRRAYTRAPKSIPQMGRIE
jgi:hypothetical protein